VHKISIPTDLIKLIRGPIERFAVEPVDITLGEGRCSVVA
jgi:hypothetical protein